MSDSSGVKPRYETRQTNGRDHVTTEQGVNIFFILKINSYVTSKYQSYAQNLLLIENTKQRKLVQSSQFTAFQLMQANLMQKLLKLQDVQRDFDCSNQYHSSTILCQYHKVHTVTTDTKHLCTAVIRICHDEYTCKRVNANNNDSYE